MPESVSTWCVGGGRRVDLETAQVMGIVNVTPDSFSDGGYWTREQEVSSESILAACARWRAEGLCLVDVGGESTRPGAAPVSTEAEIARVAPVIRAIRGMDGDGDGDGDGDLKCLLCSLDTRHGRVARAGATAGAHVINDVSGLTDPALVEVVAAHRLGVVIGHMRGTPQTMMQDTHFEALFEEVARELEASMTRAVKAGISEASIVLDPCLGFGKDGQQSAALVASGRWIEARLGRPALIGASRKRFLGSITGRAVGERMLASVTAALLAVEAGARVVRVHDVSETLEALSVRGAVRAAVAALEPA